MQYSETNKPGLADPSWYEWSVGQQYIIDMLNDDNKIKSVELQANVALGLDDVVVTYSDDTKLFIQVKHTRTDKTLTFGDLVTVDERSGKSLLRELAESWYREKNKYKDTRVCLFTNRRKGEKNSRKSSKGYKRPPLNLFLRQLRSQLDDKNTLVEFEFPDYNEAWNEWMQQLTAITSESDKITFLKCLEVETDQKSLEALGEVILLKLQQSFAADKEAAGILFYKLDHALRKWTTSDRQSSIITKEIVLDELSFSDATVHYNHYFIPSEPFFQSRNELVSALEKRLLNTKRPIIFLSGVPGTGKTNIVSKLSGKKNSIIDIRYYAYEPIDPRADYLSMDASERVKAKVFWNELFNQLRKLLKGKLAKYNVPVLNQLMTPNELRTQFFRIANDYAVERGVPFIVTIDGIDHAARAGINTETFLSTLPDPEYIPSNVKLLLAGQPKDYYRNYPDWIFNSAYVEEIVVPQIQKSDISSLVSNTFSQKDKHYKNFLTDLINKYAAGNTLAAVFALHEAENQPDLIKLEEQFINRRLSGNLQEYYNAIWKPVKNYFQIPFVDYKIAGVLAFFNEPLNEQKLIGIFKNEKISSTDWRNILKLLKPLLTEKEGNYVLAHNDVRVFLDSMIRRDRDHVVEIYSNLVDYYLGETDKSTAFYRDILRFLYFSGREQDIVKVYTADFIISAYVHGLEIYELRDNARSILLSIVNRETIDWELMRCLAFGNLTIQQIEKSQIEIGENSFRTANHIIRIHPFECYVEQEKNWNERIIEEVLSLSVELYENQETERAVVLFKHWFSDTTVVQIYEHSKREDDDFVPELSVIAEKLAKCICFTKEFSVLKGIKALSDIDIDFSSQLLQNTLKIIFESFSGKTLCNILKSIEVIYYDSMVEGIKVLLQNNRYKDILQVERALHKRFMKGPVGILLSAFMQIITGKASWSQKYKTHLTRAIKNIDLTCDDYDVDYNKELTFFSIYALVASYVQNESYTAVAAWVTTRFIEKSSCEKRLFCNMYFNNVCFLGKWLKAKNSKETFRENVKELKQLLKALFITQWHLNETVPDYYNLRAYILKGFIILSRNSDRVVRDVVDELCEEIFRTNPVNQLIDPGFYYYRNNKERLQQWFDYWLGTSGLVWKDSVSERNQTIKTFLEIKNRYDKNNDIDMSFVFRKIHWSVIGYASHKEYICDYLLNWYNKLVKYDKKYISQYAMSIKDVSDRIAILGDNRLAYVTSCKVFSDLFSNGFSEIKRVLMNNYYLAQGLEAPNFLVDGLIGLLENATFEKKDLLKIWAITMALLDWRDNSDHPTIHSLQQAIEKCADRNGIKRVRTELEKYGCAYADIPFDSESYVIPERWCDTKEEAECGTISLLEKYLEGDTEDKTSYEIYLTVRNLDEKGLLTEEFKERLLLHEFYKGSYSLYNHKILEYLVETGKPNVVDRAIVEYIKEQFSNGKGYYVEDNLPILVNWKIKTCGCDFCEQGLIVLLNMQKSWMTCAGHFQEPELEEKDNYLPYIDWEKATDLSSLFFQIIKLLILSKNADVVKTALIGLFALLRIDKTFIYDIESCWDDFHYEAKEWLIMMYELLWYFCPDSRPLLCQCLKCHSGDDDFNVALYSNLLLENFDASGRNGYIIKQKEFFNDIPQIGMKKFIKRMHHSAWLNDVDFILKIKERLGIAFQLDLDDIEERTNRYLGMYTKQAELIHIHRSSFGPELICSNKVEAFFRVLYKDWYQGRWKQQEAKLARIILSSSEPFCLFMTPRLWPHNNGKLIDDTRKFMELPVEKQKSDIKGILEVGLKEDDLVIAGALVEYSYKKEIFGFLLTSWVIPFITPEKSFERSSRLFLQNRGDFEEDEHFNITLRQNGITAFNISNFMCGFSKAALEFFDWSISVTEKGIKVINGEGKQIGRFEYLYGKRDVGNRYNTFQPHLLRWVINKEEFEKTISEYEFSAERIVDIFLSDLPA